VIRVGGPRLKKDFRTYLFSSAKARCMKINHNGNRIDTTLGDLIAAISDVAFEYSADAKEAYRLTRLVLMEILPDACPRGDIVDPPFFWN
jgi:hypothetical protein